MTVYVLFHETNTGGGDDSDGFVEAVYANEADAERDRILQLRKLVGDGRTVYTDPDTGFETNPPNDDWSDDLVVIEFQVVTGEPLTVPGNPPPAGWQRIEAGPEQKPAKPVLAAVQRARESARVAECDLHLALQACRGKGAEYMVLYGLATEATRVSQKLAELAAQLEDAR